MLNARSVGCTAVLAGLLIAGTATRAQQVSQDDAMTCQASGPMPAQSAGWGVAFCNRTHHDLVVEFRDNECPADGWRRRGDVYRKSIRRGETVVLSLCYAAEPQTSSPAPGIPAVRIPGGKGVVTTWSVIGDCGDGSDQLHLDARTFYDRGDYKTGIVLLQYPAGPPHCIAGYSGPGRSQAAGPVAPGPAPGGTGAAPAAGAAATAAASAAGTLPAGAPASGSNGAGATRAAGSPATPAGPAPASALLPVPGGAGKGAGAPPTMYAIVDTQDKLSRTVQVLSNDRIESNYRCNFVLSVSFTDGGSWVDKGHADVPGTGGEQVVAIRKYFKSVTKVTLTSGACIAR